MFTFKGERYYNDYIRESWQKALIRQKSFLTGLKKPAQISLTNTTTGSLRLLAARWAESRQMMNGAVAVTSLSIRLKLKTGLYLALVNSLVERVSALNVSKNGVKKVRNVCKISKMLPISQNVNFILICLIVCTIGHIRVNKN